MHPKSASGFQEIAHTADWELEVWAPSLEGLLEQAALGMYKLMGTQLSSDLHFSRPITLPYTEPEILLIDFLNELLFLAESEQLAFDHFDFKVMDEEMRCTLTGAQVKSMDKEIKAATFHNLNINETDQQLMAKIVFDV